MTYTEILNALGGAGTTWGRALERCVEEEGRALLRACRLPRHSIPALRVSEDQARTFYAEDITAALAHPEPIRPEDVISSRRKPAAWAIARVLEERARSCDFRETHPTPHVGPTRQVDGAVMCAACFGRYLEKGGTDGND